MTNKVVPTLRAVALRCTEGSVISKSRTSTKASLFAVELKRSFSFEDDVNLLLSAGAFVVTTAAA